jgi:hypothetical protein
MLQKYLKDHFCGLKMEQSDASLITVLKNTIMALFMVISCFILFPKMKDSKGWPSLPSK